MAKKGELGRRILLSLFIMFLMLGPFSVCIATEMEEMIPPIGTLVDSCKTENGLGQLIEVYDMENMMPRTLVIVQGPPFEMGYQYGILTGEGFDELLRVYCKQMLAGLSPILGMLPYEIVRPLLLLFAKTMEPHIPEEYIEQMRGMADGCGV